MVFVDRKWIEEMESHKQKLEAHIIPGCQAFSEDPRKTSNDGKIKSKPSRHHLDSMVTRNIPTVFMRKAEFWTLCCCWRKGCQKV